MTPLELKLFCALKLIAKGYDSPDRIRRNCEKKYGLPYEEAIGYAYENIQSEAAAAIKGLRLPKQPRKPEIGE